MKNTKWFATRSACWQRELALGFACLLGMAVTPVKGQQWTPVGPNDFEMLSYAGADYIHAAKGPGKSLYVVFQDQSSGYKAVAWKYADAAWTRLGTEPISSGFTQYTDIAVNSQGMPYVVYQDMATGSKATVKQFTGGSWSVVGQEEISTAIAYQTRIAMGPDDTPYIVYRDGAEGSKATVKKWSGGAWVTVGVAGFTTGVASWPSIAIGSDGAPFVAYSDYAGGSKAAVKKFDGTNWVNAGTNAWLSTGIAENVEIALSGGNTPYVLYRDVAAGYKATVKKLGNSLWSTVGQAGFSDGNITATSLAIAPGDTVYAAYADNATGGGATVKKFNGAQWETVGVAGFTPSVKALSLVVSNTGGLCLAYADWRAKVSCFEDGAWQLWSAAGIVSPQGHAQPVVSPAKNPYLLYTYGGQLAGLKFEYPFWKPLPATAPVLANPSLIGARATGDESMYALCFENDLDTPFVRVLHYHNDAWTTLSNAGLYHDYIAPPALAPDPAGTPYLAYSSYDKVYVYRFDGARWQPVGDAITTTFDNPGYTALAFAADNTLFLAFRHSFGGITVKKYSASGWETVGDETVCVSENMCNYGFDVSATGIPYVLYKDRLDWQVRLLRYAGNQWAQVGDAFPADTLTASSTDRVALALAGSTPYVMYQEFPSRKAIVQKWNGQAWKILGGGPVSVDNVFEPVLIATADRTLYASYTYNSSEVFVKSYDDACTAVVSISGPDSAFVHQAFVLSAGAGFASYTWYTWDAGAGVVLSGQGTPQVEVLFSTPGPDTLRLEVTDIEGCTATAMWPLEVLEPVSSAEPAAPVVRVFPNPFSDRLYIEYFRPSARDVSVRMLDVAGRTCWEQPAARQGLHSIQTAGWEPGVYFVQAGNSWWRVVKK